MKDKKFMIVSIILLTMLCMGAASAAEDNATSDVALETADFDVSSQSVDEIDAGGDTDLSESASADDNSAAVSSDVKNSKDEKLGNANDEVISAPDGINYDVYVSPDGDGDGYSIDTPTSFENALQIVPEGGSIFLLNGQYEINDFPLIGNSVSFVGESRDGVEININGAIAIGDPSNPYNPEYTIDSVSFSDLTLISNNDYDVIYVGGNINEFEIINCVINSQESQYNNAPFMQVAMIMGDSTWSTGTFNFRKNIVYNAPNTYFIYVAGYWDANFNDNLFLNYNAGQDLIDFHSEGTLNVDYNYWGSNEPEVYLDYEYYILFDAESDASEINTDETATISVYATLNDGSSAAEHLPDLVTVDLSANGNLNPESANFEDGGAQSTYSSSVARNDNVNVNLYGNNIASVPIRVSQAASLDFTVNDISDVEFGNGVTVSGTITPSNQAASLAIKVNNNLVITITATGTYSQAISASDLRAGLNTVEVTANVITKSKTFNVIKIGLDVDSEIDLGDDNRVTVTIPDGTGTVTIKVNDNVIATPTLSDGSVTQTISASDIVEGENTVEVIYNGFTNSTTFNAISSGIDISSDIEVADTWVNYATTIYATCPVESGSVTIKVNGRNVATAAVNNGEVSQEIAAQYLNAGTNTVEVAGDGFSGQTTFTAYDYDGVVTADTFFNYFNRSNSNRLCDHVPVGATLDFQGNFIGTSSVSYVMEINKPINMVSTTKNAYIDLDTVAQGMSGQNPGNRFTVSYNGSGTNISDIYFHNSQIWIFNAHNLTMTNFTSYVENQQIGSGVGVVAFRGGSSHIKVRNCFFYTENNGGSSTFVLTNASYVSVDNCTIQGEGNVGNLIYLNLYNLETMPEGTYLPQILQMIKKGQIVINDHNNFTNCRIIGPSTPLGICYIFTEQGNGYTIFENNTIYYNGSNINPGSYSIVRNNVVIGSCDMSIAYYGFNNTLQGPLTVAAGAEAIGNTAGSLSVSGKDAKIINNTINGDVSLSNKATGTNFTGNTVTGTLTVQSGSSTIVGNNITSTGSYAVDLKTTSNNIVTDNYLVSSDKQGDEAVNVGSGTDNVVENNIPIDVGLALTVEKTNFWLPNTNTLTVTVAGEGTVEIKVNGETIATPAIDNGEAVYTIAASDIKAGENTVTAIYQGAEASETFYVYGLVNNETWDMYFDRDNSGRLKDFVPEGATLDFQGKFLSSQDESFVMEINKPVNIFSSTKDVLIDLNTTAGTLMGDNPGDRFTVSNGGSGSNISDLNFHNSQIWVYNAHHVVLDHISNVIDGQRVGSGVGATSIRANSTYVTVKNSYFYTKDNGGSSSLVMAWADYCTFQNNTVEVEGNVGNLIYLTTYNVDVPSGVIVNHHNNITDNTVRRLDGQSAAICWGIAIGGPYNLIKNNTIYYAGGTGITGQYGGGSGNGVGNVYIGNKLYNAAMSALSDAIVCDNYIEGSSLTVASGGEVYNNTVVGSGTLTVTSGTVYDNTVNKIVLDGANTIANGTFNNLDVKSNVNLSDIEVTGTLRFIGSNSIVSNSTVNDVVFGESRSVKATNSKLVDSTIEGTVTLTQRGSEGNALIGDNITQTVTAQGVGDIIYQNNIITTSSYAVDATHSRASGCNITDNYLISNGKKGNAAVTYTSGKDHIVENNGPDLVLEDVADVLMGNDNVIPINVLPTFRNTEVTIKVNDNIINETQAGGLIEQTVKASDMVLGENTVEVTAYGITKIATFNVFEIIIDVTEEIIMGEDNTATITINGGTGTVSIKLNGNEIATPTLEDGSATQVISADDMVIGENTIEVTYNGFTNSTTFNVIETFGSSVTINPIAGVTYPGDVVVAYTVENKTTVTVVVKDGEDNEVTDGVDVSVDGQVTISGLDAGDYSITISNAEEGNYEGSSATADFTVETATPSLDVTISEATYPGDVTITVTSDVDGVVLLNVYDFDEYNEDFEIDVVDGTGSVVISGLNAGDYYTYASFDAGNNYEEAEDFSDFTVEIAGSSVTIDPIASVTYPDDVVVAYTVVNKTTVTVVVRDGEDNEITDGVDVSVDGQVTISGLDAGDYSITISNAKEGNYDESTATADFTVEIALPDIEVTINEATYPDDVTITVTSDVDGVAYVNVYNDDDYDEDFEIDVVDGTGSVVISGLDAGSYGTVIVFDAGDNYEDVDVYPEFTVNRASLDFEVDISGATYPDDVTITITSDVDGVADVKVYNDDYEEDFEIEVVNGTGSIAISGLDAGDYSTIIVYDVGDNYEDADAFPRFTVGIAGSSVVIDPIDAVSYPDDVVVAYTVENKTTVTVVVKDGEGNEITDGVDVSVDGAVTISGLDAGDYTITISNAKEGNYDESSATAEFTVKMANLEFEYDISEATYPDDVTITVTSDVDGVAKVQVTNYDDYDGEFVINVVNGTGSVVISGLNAGDYDAFITYSAGDNYREAYELPYFTVDVAVVDLEVAISEATYPDDVTITVTSDVDGVANVRVYDYADYDETFVIDVVDGTGSVVISGLNAGDYYTYTTIDAGNNYEEADDFSEFTVNLASLDLEVAISEATYPGDVTITVTSDVDGVANVNVYDFEDYDEYFEIDVVNGTGSVVISGLDAGDYYTYTTFDAGDNYEEAEDFSDFTVEIAGSSVVIDPIDAVTYPCDVVVSYTVENKTTVTVVVEDSEGNEITEGVDVSVDGVVTISGLDVGDYSITISNAKEGNYDESSATAEFTVSKVGTSLSASDLTMDYNDGSAWTVTLTDANGDAIAGAVVKMGININGVDKVYSRVTDENGVASMLIGLASGTYAVNATFEGNDTYEYSFVNATVTVNKAAAILTGDSFEMSYKDGSAWTVTLTDANGIAISGVKITLGIENKTYKLTTNGDGVVELTINFQPGTYDLTASLSNSKYEAQAIAATVTVNKLVPTLSAEDLVMNYKDGSEWNVTLKDAAGNIMANTNVKFTIGNKTYTRKTNDEGIASLPIGLPVGEYTISAHFDGTTTLDAVSVNSTIVVNQPEYDIVGEDVNMTYKDGTTYNVQITDGDGNPVAKEGVVIKMTINGKSYNRKTNEEGIASLAIGLKSGTYDITAEYNGKVITNTIVVNRA